jgi:hypothetical protein
MFQVVCNSCHYGIQALQKFSHTLVWIRLTRLVTTARLHHGLSAWQWGCVVDKVAPSNIYLEIFRYIQTIDGT